MNAIVLTNFKLKCPECNVVLTHYTTEIWHPVYSTHYVKCVKCKYAGKTFKIPTLQLELLEPEPECPPKS